MTNERIGSFIAAMRKEKNLTQEQLAERLGVSNRSVSRWENGKTLPDLNLMTDLCRVLDLNMTELLRGEKSAPDMEIKEAVTVVISMAQREQRQKAKSVNACLITGLLLLAAVVFYEWFWVSGFHSPAGILLAILGMGLLTAGIVRNSRIPIPTERELDVLSATEAIQMKTAGEMAAFAQKYQKPAIKQQHKAFKAIANILQPEEYAMFSLIANEYGFDKNPSVWHAVLVLTDRRLLLCGEAVRGRLMTCYTPEWLEREEICAIESRSGECVIHGTKNTVTVAGSNMTAMAERLEKILNK